MDSDLETVMGPDFSGAVLVRNRGRRRIAVNGWADMEQHVAVTASTRFNTASITKLITAVAVCRLVEAGAFGLDQSLDEVIPNSGIPHAGDILIEHLLTHTAGFPEEAPDDEDDVVGEQWLANARTPLLFEPGTGWAYSNIGYGVLGAVMEQATGRPFADAVEELVLDPAGMTETRLREAKPPASATGYVPAERNDRDDRSPAIVWLPAESVGLPKPYGYAWSTVEDLERLVDAIGSGSLIGPVLRQRVLHGEVATGQQGRRAGFGMFEETVEGRSISTLSGAGPGISAWLDVIFEAANPYLAIVLSNRPKPAAHTVGGRLRRRQVAPSSDWTSARTSSGARYEDPTRS